MKRIILTTLFTLALSLSAHAQFQRAGVPSNFTPAATDNTTVFTLAAGEIGFIQNLSGTVPLLVKEGASPTTSSFSYVLAAGAADYDGKGGTVKIDSWIGAVSVRSQTGGAPLYIAWKQAP